MRSTNRIFETESYRGTGVRSLSGASIVCLVLGGLSVLAAILIIANFDTVTALIAMKAAEMLTSGFMILIAIVILIYVVVRIRWGLRRRFWGF